MFPSSGKWAVVFSQSGTPSFRLFHIVNTARMPFLAMLTQNSVCIQAVFQIYIFMISSFAYVTPFPTKLYEI